MSWKVKDVMDQRIAFSIRASSGKEELASLCREFGISRPTGYKWRSRFKAEGRVDALVEKSRRAHQCPHKTSKKDEARVVALRKEWGWGARKLQILLKDQQGLCLNERTINRILDRHGMITVRDRIQQATKRFQRENPNELWQMDFKGEFKNAGLTCYPLTLLDDCSRFSLGIYSLKGVKTFGVDKSLIHAFETYGLPDAILTDHGSPWWSTHSEHGLTKLSVSLIKQGIKLYFSGVGHPQTQGKIERFHRTLKQEVRHRGPRKTLSEWQRLFDTIRDDYNNIRPHESLGMTVPCKKYRPSTKQYLKIPKPWEYPTGSQVTGVDIAGCIRSHGKQLFVSHSLAGEKVRLQRTDDSVIVTYRHMVVRQINENTGVGIPFPIIKV